MKLKSNSSSNLKSLLQSPLKFCLNQAVFLFCIFCCTSFSEQDNISDEKTQNRNISIQQIPSKKIQDTMKSWMSNFFKLNIIEFSKDGNWVVAKKWYDYNSDTIIVMDTRKLNRIEGQLIKKNKLSFLKNHILLASGNGETELWNLNTHQRKTFENTAKTETLTDAGQFFIVDKNAVLTVYNDHGIVQQTINGLKNYVTDGKNVIYAERKVGNGSEIIEIRSVDNKKKNNNSSKNQNKNKRGIPKIEPRLLYSTEKIIERFELSLSGKHLMVTEKDAATQKRNLIFIGIAKMASQKPSIADQNVSHPLGKEYQDSDFFKVTEIQNGQAYFIESQKSIKKKDNVEIWYGNDGELRDMQYGKTQRKYSIYDTYNNILTEIPNEKLTTIVAINNSRFFLAFSTEELQNYESLLPNLNMHLYDLKTKSFQKLDTVKPVVYTSKSGDWMVYKNLQNNWILYNPNTQEKRIVGSENLKEPVFSFNEQLIYFESENDGWEYDIKKGTLRSLDIGSQKKTEVLNKKRTSLVNGFNFFQNTVENPESVLFTITDLKNNEVSVVEWSRNKKRTIISPRISTIKNLKFDENMQQFCFVEENFNMPSKILIYDKKARKEQVVFEDGRDEQAKALKQEILHYKNAEGTPLKAILYYPAHFDDRKKLPMVVRIYQVQSDEATQYRTPGYNNPIGFDLRAQLERGYFVLMPDIVFTKTGTGLSALDFVNKAMDEAGENQNIDMKKVALMGHSHGGYETNFIATHSDRFSAYISGAGNSDIIRSYFSYNYNFSSPFYWQFENGQYEMDIPFSEDKELYVRNNPIHHVERVNAPILLWAGKKDENIAWDQVMEFYVGLKRNKKEVIALFYSENGHDLEPNTAERRDLHARVLEWLDYFLRDKKEVEWIDKQMKSGKF